MDLAGRPFSVEIGKVAELAGGAALCRYGETVVLVTATAADKPRAGIDYFPLSVDYEERYYAAGKLPGGWNKREGRPTEHAILTSRLIDRPIRPLFPKNYRNDVGVVATVMSVEQDCSPDVAAMIGASIALSISEIPFQGPTSATYVGMVDGKFVFNPTIEEREKSSLVLTVASTREKVMMIEAGANEISEDDMFEAIMLGHNLNVQVVEFIDKIVAAEGKAKHSYEDAGVPDEIASRIRELISADRMEAAVFHDQKQARDEAISKINEEVFESLLSNASDEAKDNLPALIGEAIYGYEKETVRRMILRDHKRPDGRRLDEIRHLEAEVDILPRTHGSGLFRRGQTQVLTVATLGTAGEAQKLDGLDILEETKRYMHHYNFPSFSVGETRPSRGPGRREIGHGALAERALLSVIPTEEEFPYAIRLVSEVVSSNGSTSQGAVCASTLALMAAGVPIKRPVAGISVGLVTGESIDDFVLLTDIQGIEDFFGDMDFKVAGTTEGITAIQLDIKLDGLTPEIIRLSLDDAKKSRLGMLAGVMKDAIAEPRAEISKYAPKIQMITINPDKLSEVIGSKGKVINRIIDESGVLKIDTMDDGRIFIAAAETEQITKAVNMILAIATDPEVGTMYTGKVTRLMTFGCFVEIAPEKEGLVHISQLAYERVKSVEDVVKEGDMITVKLVEIDDQGRINLSAKAALPVPDGYEVKDDEFLAKRPPQKPREGGDRRGGDRDRRPPRR
ncbi:MAG: polyribonucleotide nucleotidyltransferase [Defluviitaleaceae bacterium]|nr:polyribonucleotide nucleotidyltransferase [Defluviitaleaceae bacterium]